MIDFHIPSPARAKTFERIGAGKHSKATTEEDSNTAELVGEEGIGKVVALDAPIKTRGAPGGST